MSDFEARVVAKLDTSEFEKQMKNVSGKHNIKLNVDSADGSKQIDSVNTKLRDAEKNSRSFGDTLKSALGIGSGAAVITKAFQTIQKAIRNAIAAVKDFDSAIKDLRMATGESYESVSELVSQYNALGKELGATTIEVTSSADAWLRQGHDIETTNELIRDSMILSKVANLDSAESTEYLTSAMKGYKVAAEDVIGIVDKLTAVDLVSATDAGGLAEAMSRTAVSADMAGVSMDKLLGYLAAVGETTQKSMSSVGESFKTIFQRMSDIKTNKLELVDADGTTETLSDVEQTLKNVGIDLRATVSEYNNYGDILDNLASKWNSLTQVQQNAITKAFAGVRQSENFRVLMENYSNAQAYMTTAMESAGTAEQKFESYLDSLEAKSKTLQASFESLATNTFSSDLIGDIMDASASMMDFLEQTNLVKGAIAGIGTVGAIKGISALAGGVKDAAINMNAFGTAMKLLKAGNLGEAEFEQLVQATKNLSDSQIEAVLSSKALSIGQRTAILTAKGMSAAEAQAKLASMGLATAEGTATTATFSLSGAIQGLWATLMANPLILVAAAVTAIVSAYSSYKQKVEEARRASLEAGEAAKNESDKIRDLLTAYEQANTAYENNTGSKESLETATTDLLAALGVEQSQLETLIEKYGDLDTAIHAVTVDSLKKSLTELTSGYQAAIDELLDATDKIEASGRFGVLSSVNGLFNNSEELGNTFTDVLVDAGLISPFEVGVKGKYEIFLGNEGKTDTLENVIALYENIISLQEELEKGVAEGKYTREQLANSNLWQDLSNKLNSFKDEYADVFDYINKINETAARIQIMEWQKNNEIPETEKDIEAFKQQMISAAQSSGEFVGSQEDIQNAVINTISSMYGFADAERQYADGAKKAAENTDDLANAFDMSSIKDFTGGLEKLQKVYTDIADGGDFDFSNVIDEDFTETFGDLGDAYGAFMQTVAETPDDVNACKSAFQNLANAYLQNVGNLEDLDANTKAVTAAMLEQMGVSNAAEAVEESLVKQKVLAAAEDFRDMTVEETESIYALCQALAIEQSVLDKINRLKNVTQYLNDGIITTDADGHTWTESELANEKTKLENELRDFFKNNKIELDFDFSKLTKGAKASTDGLPEKYESDLKEIKRQLDMGEKTEAEYYEALEKLSNDYLTKDEKFVDELNSNRAAIRSFQQKSIEELYNATKKLVEQELQDQIEALDAETDAIKDSVAAQKEALEAASEAYNASIEKKISAIESEIDRQKAVADAAKKRVEAEKKAMQDSTKAQISAYNAQKDSIKKTADAEKKAAEDRYKAIEKEIKGKISLLEKEKKEYEKLADAKKKALQDEVDSEDYEYELSQKQSNLTELNRELASLQNNNSASAQKRKAELQDEIAAMQRDIYTFQRDRNVDLAVESIEADLEAKRTEYDSRVDALNEELEKKKEAYDAEIEQIEAVRDAQIESIEAQIDALNNYMDMQEAAFDRRIEQIEAELAAKEEELNKKKAKLEEEKKAHEAATKAKEKMLEEYEKKQTQSLENQKKELEKNLNNQEYLRNATLKKIAEDNSSLYEELNTYNKKYGDGINNSIISMWNAATRAVNRYKIAATATGIADEVAKAVQGYASGTMNLPYSGIVQTDERGYEIKLNRKSGNNYEFMNSGSVILPNDFTSKIMAFVADPERYVQHVLPNGNSNIGSVVQENINNVVNNNPVEVRNETVNNYNITGDSPEDIARQIDKISKKNIDNVFDKLNAALRKNGMGRRINQMA